MDINLTLLGQLITFLIFVGFTMKYVWPPMMSAIESRQKEVADGLEAADRGRRELEESKKQVSAMLAEAREDAKGILSQANARSAALLEAAEQRGREAFDNALKKAQEEIKRSYSKAAQELKQEEGEWLMTALEHILSQKLDPDQRARLLETAVAEIASNE